ncbi:radical SAM protein [Chitinimonas sp.]|uniref:radical SAM protein n=1 Tax=Chitinimonas sp. TaxID=1934313 RepID=UPI002F95C5AC
MEARQLTLQLTWACDIRCAHCSQDHVRTHLDLAVAKQAIEGLLRHGEINRLSFTGGEPFLRFDAMLELARFGAQADLKFGIVTNARWAKSAEKAHQRLAQLAEHGLDVLVISHDEFHEAFVPDEAIAHLLNAAEQLGVATQFYVSRNDTTPIPLIQQCLSERFGVAGDQVLVRDVVPLGHGAALPISTLARSYFEQDRECPVRNEYNLWPDGEMLPCCSAGTHIGLSLGNLQHDSIDTLVARRRQSRLLGMLHRHDMAELVLRLPEPIGTRLASQNYVSACHLCHAILSEPNIHVLVEGIDPEQISLIEKVLHTPAAQARLTERVRQLRRAWPGPPVVAVPG